MGGTGAFEEPLSGVADDDMSLCDSQQEQLLPTPSASPAPDTAAPTTEAAQPSPTPSQSLSDRVATLHFPRRPFDLSPEPSIQIAAFQRGLVPKGSKHESPVPDDAPLREVSVPLPDGETSGRGKRKKRAAAGGSPRKKQKVDKKPSGGEEEDSELSELSEDADEDADESAEEGGDGEEEAEEDVEEDDGTSVTGTAATVDDDSASTATEADAKRKPADKGWPSPALQQYLTAVLTSSRSIPQLPPSALCRPPTAAHAHQTRESGKTRRRLRAMRASRRQRRRARGARRRR